MFNEQKKDRSAHAIIIIRPLFNEGMHIIVVTRTSKLVAQHFFAFLSKTIPNNWGERENTNGEIFHSTLV